MEIQSVYTKKEYVCNKCNQKIYYAKIADELGDVVTKDGRQPNGKYGKESNTLSAAVNVSDRNKFHECYKEFAEKQYNEALLKKGTPEKVINNLNMPTFKDGKIETDVGEFITIADNAYQKIFILSSKLCESGATVKDKHITTMGLLHDYFDFRSSRGL
jgi:hypothetical protein